MIDTLRHSELYDPERYRDKRVAIIGVGTIGSHLALTLARMQVPLTIYDHDTIEEHNLATQSYGKRDIGRYKVDAVADQCKAIGHEINAVRGRFEAHSGEDIIVSCVDSLEARREIQNLLADTMIPVHDGRVGGEQVEVYRFERASGWQIPEQADVDPCGARFTAYTANVCAGLLANNIKRELLGQPVKARILYDAVSSSFLTP